MTLSEERGYGAWRLVDGMMKRWQYIWDFVDEMIQYEHDMIFPLSVM